MSANTGAEKIAAAVAPAIERIIIAQMAPINAALGEIRHALAVLNTDVNVMYGVVDRISRPAETMDSVAIRQQCEIRRELSRISDTLARLRTAADISIGLISDTPANVLVSSVLYEDTEHTCD